MDSFKEEDDFETLISEDNPSEFEMQEQEVIKYTSQMPNWARSENYPPYIIPRKKLASPPCELDLIRTFEHKTYLSPGVHGAGEELRLRPVEEGGLCSASESEAGWWWEIMVVDWRQA
jgi:hypothetical protein